MLEKIPVKEMKKLGGNLRTTEFLKECLADALIKLLKEKPIEKITIPEIAKLSSVGRTTYFRNFTSKNEMLTFKLVQLWERWAEDQDLRERKNFSLNNALSFFQFNYSIKNLLELIYERNVVYDAFYIVMMPQLGINVLECYKSRFYSYGLFGLLDEWIKRGFYESPEEMTEFVNHIV